MAQPGPSGADRPDVAKPAGPRPGPGSGAVDGSASERVVDAHVHVACADSARFPVRPTGVGSGWWEGGGGSAERLVSELDASGVAAAVVVQAVGVYGYDSACAAHVVAARPDRFALVAAVDLGAPDPAADLVASVAATAGGGGSTRADESTSTARPAAVRLFGVGAGGAPALHDGRAAEMWRAAAEHGVGLVPCVFSTDLDAVAAAAAAEPSVAVAVDHCGFPDREGDAGWAATLRLADVSSVSLKVTSYVLEACERDDGDPAIALDRLIGPFGAGRLCWGSDHPQQQAHTYAEKLALARHAARQLTPADRRAFLGLTAQRLWFP